MKAPLMVAVAAGLLLPSMAQAAEIKLIASAALKPAYLELLPQFEKASGHKVTAAWSSSLVIQKRIVDGEDADLIVGIQYLGPLPAELQNITEYSGGIHSGTKEAAAATALVKFLTAPSATPALKKHGLEPG